MAGTDEKTIQLGMPIGTATNRLRKTILFSLLAKHAENYCSKCSVLIASPDELSIEHIEPWLHTADPLATFFDLDNIAFSHLSCNVAARRYITPARKRASDERRLTGPPNTAWCAGHRSFQPVGAFAKDAAQWNGLQNYCKPCWAETRKSHPSRQPRSVQAIQAPAQGGTCLS